MGSRRAALLCWSSGKDSAWALETLRRRDDLEVVGLLTTVNAEHDRVAMHAVRRSVLRAQAECVGLPLHEIEIPAGCSNEQYEAALAQAVASAYARGVRAMAFGDLFLEDVRRYREDQLAGTGIEPLFPLWGEPTDALVRRMLASGLRARITCVDPRVASGSLAGRELTLDLIEELPPEIDPCGERGEFHTFAFDGRMFRRPVPIHAGETVERDGFVFTDLVLQDGASEATAR